MATQSVEFRAATGLTITAKLFSAGSDTQVASVSATEATNRKGTYTAAFTDVAAGEYQLIAFDATPIPVASWWVTLAAPTATYEVYDKANKLAIADAVLEESILDHRSVNHSLARFISQIRNANLTIEGTVSSAITPTTLTFSSNVSATTSAYAHAVLLFVSGPLTGENSPIISYNSTNGVFVLEEVLTAAPSNGDEFVVIAGSHVHSVADIQSGLATSSGVTAGFTEIKGAGWSSATDTLEEIRDAIGSSVTVAPLQATAPNRVAGTEIVTYINDTSAIGPIAITDGDGTAVNLSALTLKVCVEKIDGTVLANITPSVSGAGNNQVTFTPTSDCVVKTGTFRWSLRKTSNNQVYALGDFVVDPAARISP